MSRCCPLIETDIQGFENYGRSAGLDGFDEVMHCFCTISAS